MKALRQRLFPSVIAHIKLHGPITPLKTHQFLLELDQVNPAHTAAIALDVNSYGGYPAQSDIIASKIRHVADKHKLRIYGFVTDRALSAGYNVLCVADEIYCDRTGLVGSIGVVWRKYNFSETLSKLDIQVKSIESQRTFNYLSNPFTPLASEDRQQLRQICEDNHAKFIQFVQQHRKGKLDHSKADELFSGKVFTGEEAVKNGLVDGIGSVSQVMSSKFPGLELKSDYLVLPMSRIWFGKPF